MYKKKAREDFPFPACYIIKSVCDYPLFKPM